MSWFPREPWALRCGRCRGAICSAALLTGTTTAQSQRAVAVPDPAERSIGGFGAVAQGPDQPLVICCGQRQRSASDGPARQTKQGCPKMSRAARAQAALSAATTGSADRRAKWLG